MFLNTIKKCSLLFGLLFIYFTASAVQAQAQTVVGYSEVGYERASQKVYGYSLTFTDYNAALYYDPEVRAKLFKMPEEIILDEGENVGFSCPFGEFPCPPGVYQIAAEVYNESNSLQWDTRYAEISKHYIKSYFAYSQPQNYWYDPWGFSLWGNSFNNPEQYQYPWPQYFPFQNYVVNGQSQMVGIIEVYITTRAPIITQITPNAGTLGTNHVVRLIGTGFGAGWETNQTVNISGSGVTAQIRAYLADGLEVDFQIADNADTGDHNVTVTAGVTSNSVVFRVGDRTPQITGITPAEGVTGQNLAVIITGTGFAVNPTVQLGGTGVTATVTSATSTEIRAAFSIADSTYEGDRTVTVKSNGRLGFGFMSVPGNSPNSNNVAFGVLKTKVTIPDIGSVEKGSVKTVTVSIQNAPAQNHVTKFRFKNQTARKEGDRWITGEAKFVDDNNNDVDEISFSGTGESQTQKQIQIRGWERSSSKDNVKLEARFNNDSDVKADKSLSVSSVEFVEEAECTGYDDVEFKKTNNVFETRFFYIPRGGNNKLKAKVVPSGASGSFKLEATEASVTISPSVISSDNEQTVTISASATASRNPVIRVKANNTNSSTRDAELLYPEVLPRKEKNVVIYGVTEDNDDVQAIPGGQGAPNRRAYIILNGPDDIRSTVEQGDDNLSITPYYERPPEHRNNPQLFRIMTGANGILETEVQGDDLKYIPASAAERELYAPITTIGNGTPDAVCVTSGTNRFLDTIANPNDTEDVDPSDATLRVVKAGSDGVCNTTANDDDIAPPNNIPSATALQNYLNNTAWGRQANIFFTVDPTVRPLAVNFDLDRDGKLRYPRNNNDFGEPFKIRQTPPSDTINLYFVGTEFDVAGVRGLSDRGTPHTWFAPLSLTDGGANYTVAHEIGHSLGREGHSSEDPLATEYQRDLMYYGYQFGTINQCRIRKPDWNFVHPIN